MSDDKQSSNPPITSRDSASTVLKSVLAKPGEDSKKYTMTIIGLKLLAIGFAVSSILVIVRPSVAGYIATLAQIFLTAVGGLIGVYLGGQSASEWKASASLATVKEDKTESETVIHEERAPKASHFDDPSIA